ncbi:hypothetical protein ACT3CD_05560 [Geofilum sp. OHC36d9]|uniref:hypothetical protein n=1 Tax=Geofilum sp. OHC36d9 TaxID=3458413 RepID=UPI004033D1CD
MKNYRVKVRQEKADFFEELMRYLDFCDYEQVEGFSEPRIYPGFEMSSKDNHPKYPTRQHGAKGTDSAESKREVMENLREVMTRIEAQRDRNRKSQ